MFCCVFLCARSSVAIERRALFAFLMSCDCYCSVALTHGVVGRSAVCDCGISYSYLLDFLQISI